MQKLLSKCENYYPAIILVIWVGIVFIINPFGNFPVNDDWIYAKPVFSKLNGATFTVPNQATVTFIVHSLIGYIWCMLTGFSFSNLRILVLLEAALFILIFYRMNRRLGLPKKGACLFCLLLMTNPLFTSLSFSFMTDIPFLLFFITSAGKFLEYLENKKPICLIYGCLLAIAATWIRQPGAIIPLAILPVIFLNFRQKNIHRPLLCLLSLLPFLSLYMYPRFMENYFNLSAWYNAQSMHLFHVMTDTGNVTTILQNVIIHSILCFFYMGLFLLPLTFVIFKNLLMHPDISRKEISTGAVLFILTLGVLIFFAKLFGGMMPFSGNIITKSGIGPVMLRDTYILGLPHLKSLSPFFWKITTFLTLLGAAILPPCMYGWYRLSFTKLTETQKNQFYYLLVLGCLYTAPMLILGLYDRYILVLLPIAICILSLVFQSLRIFINNKDSKKIWIFPITTGLCIALFSILGVSDFMVLQRTRWQLLDESIQSEQISPEMVDGGFEFNGWHTYSFPKNEVRGKSWWWVIDDRYVLSLGPIPGYTIYKSKTFTRLLSSSEATCYLLRKNTQT